MSSPSFWFNNKNFLCITHTVEHNYISSNSTVGIFCYYTGYTQKNFAVSKVNKRFVSHLTLAQRTPSAAATVQASHALRVVCFSCLLRDRGAAGPVSKMASQQENAFCVLRFDVFRSVITVQREFRARFRKDVPASVICVYPIYIYIYIYIAIFC